MALLLTDIEAAVRAGWGRDTCTPECRPHRTPEETVTEGGVVPRPPSIRRCREEYDLLRQRVVTRLREGRGASS